MRDGVDVSAAEIFLAVVAKTLPLEDELVLAGSDKQLGAWESEGAISLSTSAALFPMWFVRLRPARSTMLASYKFAVRRHDGSLDFEPGPDRCTDFTGSAWLCAHFGRSSPGCCNFAHPMRSPASAQTMLMWNVVCQATRPGDEVRVVGSVAELGSWDPRRGVQLSTDAAIFPQWHGAAELTLRSEEVAWKLAILRADGNVDWEVGDDRHHALLEGRRAVLLQANYSIAGGETQAQSMSCQAVQLVVPDDSLAVCDEAMKLLVPNDSTAAGDEVLSCDTASTALPLERNLSRTCAEAEDMYSSEQGPQKLWAAGHKLGKWRSRCEDAFCIGQNCLGVADGVGSMSQYKSHGMDSAAYAAELVQLAVTSLHWTDESISSPRSFEAGTIEAICAAERGATTFGAATLTVLELSGNVVSAANLGDSGFLLVRGLATGLTGRQHQEPEVVMRSSPQQHGWNWPFQLARLPPSLRPFATEGAMVDTAADSDLYQFCVCTGDLILLFTDGLSDNLYDDDIIEVLRAEMSKSSSPRDDSRKVLESILPSPESLASALVQEARRRSRDPSARVPFNDTWEEHGKKLFGGKPDDITVVVAWVLPDNELSVADLRAK